jgi:hypothetical protein
MPEWAMGLLGVIGLERDLDAEEWRCIDELPE